MPATRFAKWVFGAAAIYGVVLLAPMLFVEGYVAHATGPLTYPEYYYGFLGVALVFQVVFWMISRDPVGLRPLMIVAVLEKLSWGAAAWGTWLQGRGHGVTTGFATADMVLAVLFAVAWIRTPKSLAP